MSAPTGVGVTRGGPKEPVRAAPFRRPGSVRRTSTIDSRRPDGPSGGVSVHATARDLRTTASGDAVVLASAELTARVSTGRILLALDHPDPRLTALVGHPVASGFRARALALMGDEAERLTLLNLLLDDLPGANLVAGYALQRHPSWGGMTIPVEHLAATTDLCAGWASDATIMVAVRATETVPTPTTAAVPLESDDPLGWHERPDLPVGATRRARRLDVWSDHEVPGLRFDAHFRDSYVDADDGEGAVHEYSLRGRVDPIERTILAIEPTAHVLPWTECPQALASAQRVVGTTVDDLRARVRTDFVGTSTCTHLNDMVRSLADLPALARPLVSTGE